MNGRQKGLASALISAIFLGLTPIFGKQAMLSGFTPLAVVAIRSCLAVSLLFLFLLIFKRGYLYIYPVGAIGCVLAGIVNGVGSILYYTALSKLNASVGQLLYSFYPLFVAIWLFFDRQPISRITLLRLILTVPGIFLLIGSSSSEVDLTGAGMMIGAAALYALHLLINQRVLYDVPAPTVTFYTLLAMAVTVTAAFLAFHPQLPPVSVTWQPLVLLGVVTFVSRLTLFMGVKHLGGIQTALIGLGELLITVALAILWLGESLTLVQWIGAVLLSTNIFLAAFDKTPPQQRKGKGFLSWLNPPQVRMSDIPFRDQ
jgi:drug/metabolite transporter (DMT)-like permease